MTEHFNETSAKKGAGRPQVDNEQIINDLLAKPDTRDQLIKQIQYLATEKRKIVNLQDIYKDDVKATKEAFGLSGGYITKLVDALVKDDVNKKVTEATLLSDLLSIFAPKEDDEDQELDEDFEG